MNINENQWDILQIQWKLMKINENQWNSMEINELHS